MGNRELKISRTIGGHSGQAMLEFILAFIVIVALFYGINNIWVWFNVNMADRQGFYTKTRTMAGYNPERASPLVLSNIYQPRQMREEWVISGDYSAMPLELNYGQAKVSNAVATAEMIAEAEAKEKEAGRMQLKGWWMEQMSGWLKSGSYFNGRLQDDNLNWPRMLNDYSQKTAGGMSETDAGIAVIDAQFDFSAIIDVEMEEEYFNTLETVAKTSLSAIMDFNWVNDLMTRSSKYSSRLIGIGRGYEELETLAARYRARSLYAGDYWDQRAQKYAAEARIKRILEPIALEYSTRLKAQALTLLRDAAVLRAGGDESAYWADQAANVRDANRSGRTGQTNAGSPEMIRLANVKEAQAKAKLAEAARLKLAADEEERQAALDESRATRYNTNNYWHNYYLTQAQNHRLAAEQYRQDAKDLADEAEVLLEEARELREGEVDVLPEE